MISEKILRINIPHTLLVCPSRLLCRSSLTSILTIPSEIERVFKSQSSSKCYILNCASFTWWPFTAIFWNEQLGTSDSTYDLHVVRDWCKHNFLYTSFLMNQLSGHYLISEFQNRLFIYYGFSKLNFYRIQS